MSDIEHANGHRPEGLLEVLNPGMGKVARPDPEKLSFDLDRTLSSVTTLQARAPEDAFSSSYLGTERRGSAVLIDAGEMLFLTIGYLVSEVENIALKTVDGAVTQAHAIAYDFATGFGLIRGTDKLDLPAMELGTTADIAEKQKVIVAPGGGRAMAIEVDVVSKREFAGYWEYLLDHGVFTSPPHPHWSGAALIDGHGKLAGIGSLFVQDAAEDDEPMPGNMFVPIDFLKPIYDDLKTRGASHAPPRPWLGMYAMEAKGHVFITSLADGGPAEEAGLEPGDLILGVGDRSVSNLADCYRKIWATGAAGVNVDLHIQRDEESLTVIVESTDRYSFMKQPRRH